MTCLQLTVFVSGTAPALSTQQQPLTPHALLEVEHAFAGTLRMLRSALSRAGLGETPEHVVQRPDAAEIEYASWMPDRGALEVASWSRPAYLPALNARRATGNDSRTQAA